VGGEGSGQGFYKNGANKYVQSQSAGVPMKVKKFRGESEKGS